MPNDAGEAANRTDTNPHFLAGKLAALGPRQREIARIVYSNAAVTPRQVQEQLSEQRSVRVVRTLLDRLVSKGLVRRRSTGRHREIIYIAAIPTPLVRNVAIQKLVRDRFGGSLAQAAMAMQELARMESVRRHPPRTSAAVRQLASERPPVHAVGHR
jgi:predicted transcriptional regulator